MSLVRSANHLRNLFMKCIHRFVQPRFKAAHAKNIDGQAAWKAHFDGFCQLVTTSGAEWACNGKGYWQLLEANGIPLETAVGDFVELLGSPARVGICHPEQPITINLSASRLAELYRLGFLLPVIDFECPYKPKGCECAPDSNTTSTDYPPCASSRSGNKKSDCSGLIHHSIKNRLKPVMPLLHGDSSKGDLGLGCTSQSTAECNARLFQRGRV
ncbi:hypothetical protein SAMN04487867_12928 [Vreelandella titanicae]|nr:hypothetical protein SAMN04487867_12928 [Halomonas titanicae]